MIRIYRQGDHVAIAEIFSRAVHEIASEAYSVEQCLAWSGKARDADHWQKRCELKRPFVAEIGGRIAGFLELDTDGHIDCAYVNPDFKRQGVVTRLVRHAVGTAFAMGLHRVHVEASICAKPLFAREGFVLLSKNVVEIDGVSLVNYRMELRNDRGNRHLGNDG